MFQTLDTGPTTRKVSHLHELDRPPADDTTLGEGSIHKDRVFLSSPRERNLIK